jgi:para-nitrobenzyl esterase
LILPVTLSSKRRLEEIKEISMKKIAVGSIVIMRAFILLAIITLLRVTPLMAAPQDGENLPAKADGVSMIKPHDHPDYVYIRTDRGVIRGQSAGEVDQFLGVPYAAPPVGDLRWKAPIPAARWRRVRDATTQGSACSQLSLTGGIPAGSEDCLYLNIYRPNNTRPGQSRPVLFWIHGGFNKQGSGNEFDPSEMVKKTGIIVVTINYRLNVFGFLALPSLDAESDDSSSGNYGLMDQQAALRWVHANSWAFGGNPHNITIAGESAGAEDVCVNLVSPTAAGLFTGAIMQSRRCRSTTHDVATQKGARVATVLGCTDPQTTAACLRSKAPADLLQAIDELQFSANVSGRLLPLEPLEALRSGQWNRAPVLLGSNHDEDRLFTIPLALATGQFPMSVQTYKHLVAVKFRKAASSVLNEYSLDDYPDPAFTYSAEITDFEFACPVSDLSQLFSMTVETRQYEFNDPNTPIPTLSEIPQDVSLGAYHGGELQYLFKFVKQSRGLSPAQEQLSDQMIRYWANFVRTGNPNGPGLVYWPRYDPNTHQVLSLRPGENIVIDNFDADHHCALWRSVPPPSN